MRFGRKNNSCKRALARMCLASAFSIGAFAPAFSKAPMALIPVRTIYPCETIKSEQVKP
ncbi:MAG: flagellar biosynthesis protein FlgA, partial [Rhizobium pusense]|nr:flagellar biosynthesis protein FlgA [Agrobacterium pusense]